MPGNSLLTIDMVSVETVRIFKNSNLFIQNVDTQYDNAFAINGAKIGDSLRIRLPNDYVVHDGPAMQLQDTSEQYTTLTIDSYKSVAIAFTSKERTLDIDEYSERYIAPAVNNIAGKCAQTVMTKMSLAACNLVANFNAGAIITPTMDTFLLANANLDDNSADQMTRYMVNDPTTDARTSAGLAGLLNPTPDVSQQFRSGMMKSGLGYNKWFRDQTVVKFTAGTFSAGGTVAGGGQSGTSITVNAITGTLKKGDIITFEGVNAVNRVTKQSLETLRQFVVTADVATTGTVIPIYPALTPAVGGSDVQYQTVDASPINGAAMDLVTAAGAVYRRSLAYVYKAITMATADLIIPPAGMGVVASRSVYDGISMRIMSGFLMQTDQIATRMDLLFGSLAVRPEWMAVVADKI